MSRFIRMAIAGIGLIVSACLTILALYSWFRSSQLALPTPSLALLLAVLVPFANVFGLRYFLERIQYSDYGFSPEILALISIVDTILMTLASSQLQPDALVCALERRWQSMFAHRDSGHIRRIQDNLNCCGFRTTRDRAWPFPSNEGADACERALGRHTSCLPAWAKQEKMLLAFMITIGGLSLLSKIVFVVLRRNPSWLRWPSERGPESRRLLGAGGAEEQPPQGSYTNDPEPRGRTVMSHSNPFASGTDDQAPDPTTWP